MNGDSGQEGRKIIGERRRRPDSAPPGGRERAGTPQRRESQGSGGYSSGGLDSGGSLDSGGGLGNLGGLIGLIGSLAGLFIGGNKGSGAGSGEGTASSGRSGCLTGNMGCFFLILIIAVIIIVFLLFSGVCSNSLSLDQLQNQPLPATEPSQPDNALSTQALSITPAASGQKWLVMLYQDADDRILEKDIDMDLNEAEKVGSSGLVKIVAQIDRYNGGFSGDGNWTGTKRFLISRDDNLGKVRL